MTTPAHLPVEHADFAALSSMRSPSSHRPVYVDKTDLIHELARVRGKLLLCRPPGFGKTLLLSAFESLFSRGLRDFQGLAIEKVWDDRTYDVVRLDFSECDGFDDADAFTAKFRDMLCRSLQPYGFQFDPDKGLFFGQLSGWMGSLPGNSLVLLIDDYDVPLSVSLGNPKLFASVRSVLSEFFSAVKRNEGRLRFFFMTGVVKFSTAGVFGGFNILTDISLAPQYAALLGFTEEDVRHAFGEHLQRASRELDLPLDDLLIRMRETYGGFCFDEAASTRTYCPRSVLHFLNAPDRGFQNYWLVGADRTNALVKYLVAHGLADPSVFADNVEVSLGDLDGFNGNSGVDAEVLLAHTGLLTIKSVDCENWATLGCPNKEVAESAAGLRSSSD